MCFGHQVPTIVGPGMRLLPLYEGRGFLACCAFGKYIIEASKAGAMLKANGAPSGGGFLPIDLMLSLGVNGCQGPDQSLFSPSTQLPS